ncbi:MAG: hypothetical protein K8R90_02075 [Candidatus Cloacimonetes bacterium]|nr:hypothetical protein [Candidatus Cloacimonadota bacterium]
MTKDQYAKLLRREIAASAIARHGWSMDGLHQKMVEWGFGPSLRKLDIDRLKKLKHYLGGTVHTRAVYDPQGRQMHALMKELGWTDADMRRFLLKRFKKTHFNVLTCSERRGVIAMLRKKQQQSN